MIYDHERGERRKTRVHYSDWMPEANEHLRSMMEDYLKMRGLSIALATWNVWYPTDTANDHHPRVVMPATSTIEANKYYWQARAMEEGVEPRYQSPHATRGDALIVVYPGKQQPHCITVVEGPMDALAAAGCGSVGVALMGNEPDDSAIVHVRRIAGKLPIRLIADNDNPSAMTRIMGRLVGQGFRGLVDVATAYPAKDLAAAERGVRMRIVRGGRVNDVDRARDWDREANSFPPIPVG